MSRDLTSLGRRNLTDVGSPGVVRRTNRQIDHIRGRAHVARADIEARAEEAATVVLARNAVAAAAAQADARLGTVLSALPITDATDADFRAQLRQATRAHVVADICQFEP